MLVADQPEYGYGFFSARGAGQYWHISEALRRLPVDEDNWWPSNGVKSNSAYASMAGALSGSHNMTGSRFSIIVSVLLIAAGCWKRDATAGTRSFSGLAAYPA